MTTTSELIEVIVTVRVGRLSTPAVRHLRSALGGCSEGPTSHLVIDLRGTDDAHELSVFALLSDKARTVTIAGGTMTAIGPSRRLGHLLATTGIRVVTGPLTPHPTARTERLSVGLCAA